MPIIGIILAVLVGIIFPITMLALHYNSSETIATKTSYVSDADILLYLSSPHGQFSTTKDLADHFGLKKTEMIHRLGFLKRRYIIKAYSNGIKQFHRLRFELPKNIQQGFDEYLDMNRLLQLFDKYGSSITLATIVVETGLSAKDAGKIMKDFTKEKVVSRISDMQGDRRYVLAAHLRQNSEAMAEDSGEEVLQLVNRRGGRISIDDLAAEQHIAPEEAQDRLELLERRDLLKLTLDSDGNPLFELRE